MNFGKQAWYKVLSKKTVINSWKERNGPLSNFKRTSFQKYTKSTLLPTTTELGIPKPS